mmetsp:Transcript_14891/g.56466  ORF Transcript_14891/g.56466 Transcript_14891/m.56466 type:complete len:229 (-) Transcript_14891:2050-2736(-)
MEENGLVQTDDFQHMLRVLNTNIDGRRTVIYALTSIKGIGRRFADLICKKAEIDSTKRAGEMDDEEIERLIAIIANPRHFEIPGWFLNRQKDYKTGKDKQVYAQNVASSLRDDLTRLKQIRSHKVLRDGNERCCDRRVSVPEEGQTCLNALVCFHLQFAGYPPLLGCACAWTAHLYHWPSPYCGGNELRGVAVPLSCDWMRRKGGGRASSPRKQPLCKVFLRFRRPLV